MNIWAFLLGSLWRIGCCLAAFGVWCAFERLNFRRGLRRIDRTWPRERDQ